jgi:hypothetical protein
VLAVLAAGATERPREPAGAAGPAQVAPTVGHENLHDLDVHHAASVRL